MGVHAVCAQPVVERVLRGAGAMTQRKSKSCPRRRSKAFFWSEQARATAAHVRDNDVYRVQKATRHTQTHAHTQRDRETEKETRGASVYTHTRARLGAWRPAKAQKDARARTHDAAGTAFMLTSSRPMRVRTSSTSAGTSSRLSPAVAIGGSTVPTHAPQVSAVHHPSPIPTNAYMHQSECTKGGWGGGGGHASAPHQHAYAHRVTHPRQHNTVSSCGGDNHV
jgi:hypothetical protein